MDSFSTSLALWEGNPLATNGFPSQRTCNASFDISFDLHLNKRLNKQWTCQWFEMSWRPCDVTVMWNLDPLPPGFNPPPPPLSKFVLFFLPTPAPFIFPTFLGGYPRPKLQFFATTSLSFFVKSPHTHQIPKLKCFSSCNDLCPIHWSQVLSWECRRCSNYIWVIDSFIAY